MGLAQGRTNLKTMRSLRCAKHGIFSYRGPGNCLRCNREQRHIELKAYVASRGGILLDEALIPRQRFARILCLRHGVQRLAIFGALSRRAVWCSACKFDRLRELLRKPYREVEAIVHRYGYALLTTERQYRNSRAIAVRCPNGHRSIRNVHSFVRGRGCRSCYARQGEAAVRAVFERIFGTEFPLRRPIWLRSARGGRLELDG